MMIENKLYQDYLYKILVLLHMLIVYKLLNLLIELNLCILYLYMDLVKMHKVLNNISKNNSHKSKKYNVLKINNLLPLPYKLHKNI